MKSITVSIITVALTVSVSANALDMAAGTLAADKRNTASVGVSRVTPKDGWPMTYRNRGNGRYTADSGGTARSYRDGRLVDMKRGVTYRDRGHGRFTGSDGSICYTRGKNSVVCH